MLKETALAKVNGANYCRSLNLSAYFKGLKRINNPLKIKHILKMRYSFY